MAVLKSTLKLSLLDDVSARARRITGVLNDLQRRQTAFMTPLRSGLGSLLALGAGYVGVTSGVDSTVGAAMRFESAFADVRKVVDATDQQFAEMRKNIRSLATTLPTTAADLAALYAAGGESGIATADLNEFALMAARVGIAFDMSAGKAGESLAKLKTQLGITIGETGEFADAVNHLSNNMASKASDITEFMLRVGAFTKIGGLAKEQTAALGSAMIAAGADPSTAATAMQNVVKAMTRGASAKKSQKAVAKALGLNLPQLAKDMQKDAPAAIKKVLAAIGKAPKDQHVALLSDFFGDEAKAFAPLIGNLGLLDQALQSVDDRTKYAGSAFREYVERANTTANVLSILRNKFSEVGMQLGDRMLPTVKEAALGIGDILDTLDERSHVFDDIRWAWNGLLQGMGASGDIRQQINDLGDLLFGEAEGPTKKQDHIAAVFARFREYGVSIRELSDAIRNNPIAQFLAPLLEQGFKLMLASVGFAVAARSLRLLGSALYFLSGASTVAGILKTVAGIQGALNASTAAGGLQGAAATSGTLFGTLFAAAAGAAIAAGLLVTLRELDPKGDLGGITKPVDDYIEKHTGWNPARDGATPTQLGDTLLNALPGGSGLNTLKDLLFGERAPPTYERSNAQLNAQRGSGYNPLMEAVDSSRSPVKIDPGSILEMTRPSGTQDVRVTNQQPVSVNVSAPITITGVIDPRAAAAAATSDLGAKTKAAVESSLGGGGGF